MADESMVVLSALMDGEVDDAERQHATDVLLADAQALAQWRRYHVARNVLQRPAETPLPADWAARMSAAIAAEATYSLPTAEAVDQPHRGRASSATTPAAASNVVPLRRVSSPRRALIGLAAAAGIGVTAWVGLPGLSDRGPTAPGEAGNPAPDAYRAVAMSSDEALRARGYMFLHARESGMNHVSQAIPFAKVVSFETP